MGAAGEHQVGLAPADDLDGLADGLEEHIGTNPFYGDTDRDGWTDGKEVDRLGTDPLEAAPAALVFDAPATEADAGFGSALDSAGDVDGEGRDDFLVGAPRVDRGALVDAGAAYLFSGEDGQIIRTFDDPNAQSGAQFGASVASIADVDGDSVPIGMWRILRPRRAAIWWKIGRGGRGATCTTIDSRA